MEISGVRGRYTTSQYSFRKSNLPSQSSPITNYAVLLTDMGQPDVGLSALRKLCRVIREYNSDTGLDYASVQEAMGNISLTMGEISQATSYFQKAMEIYETVFEFEPDMIEAKKQELLGTYAQAGLYLGEKLLTKEGDI